MRSHATTLQEQFNDVAQQAEAAKLGMWAFLATEILLFGALFCVYFCYRVEFGAGFAAASRHTDVVLGTLETIVLLTSSLSMALAVRAAGAGERRATTWLIAATVALGSGFVVIHGVEYAHEFHEHLFPGATFSADLRSVSGAQMFFLLYYTCTALHGLHVCIGIGVLVWLGVRSARGAYSRAYATPVEIGALYWHLVDVVWIFLFPLFYLVTRT